VRRRYFGALTAIVLTVLPAAGSRAQQQWAPPPITNLKVLPSDTAPRAVVMMMRGFTQGLGVRCQHCHVYKGEDPNDLSAFDFASDEKPAKQTARAMLRMVLAINNEHLKDVGEARPVGEMKVTCYTCHRGETRPLTRRPAQ
jgi:hypothetical protein